MKSALLFHWRWLILLNLGCCGFFGALSFVGSQLLRISFFATYYHLMPLMSVMFLTIYAFYATTTYRNLALSMGCRRRDYFWASQAAYVISALLCVGVTWLTGALPELLGMDYAVFSHGTGGLFSGRPVYCSGHYLLFLLAVCLLVQPVGGAMGCLYFKSKAWAGVFLSVVSLFGIAATVISLFVFDGSLHIPAFIPRIILGALGVSCAVGEVWYWHSNKKAVVV